MAVLFSFLAYNNVARVVTTLVRDVLGDPLFTTIVYTASAEQQVKVTEFDGVYSTK